MKLGEADLGVCLKKLIKFLARSNFINIPLIDGDGHGQIRDRGLVFP